MTVTCAAALAAASAAPAQALEDLPPGFQERTISGTSTATAFAAAPDGRVFITEKRGRVRVVTAAGQLSPVPVIDISDHVNTYVDHGLLGIALDRDFASNGWMYLYYVYEHNKSKATGPKVARVTRVTVNPDNTVANPLTPETIILGTYAPAPVQNEGCPTAGNLIDCIPAETTSHNGGTLRVDPADGTIWLSVGDANFGYREPNRFRPFNEKSLAGKIIHMDRNGKGLADHPYCPTNADLSQVCTKIYASGFRNPWRMTLRPNGLGPVIGDVGEARYEEIDFVERGRSYGWPCYEGDQRFGALQATARCQTEYSKEGTATASLNPLWTYGHGPYGAAVIGGPIYTGTQFPVEYRDDLYVGDIVLGWIKRLVIDSSGHVSEVHDFANGFQGVDLQMLPNGHLAYLTIGGTLGFISFDSSNLPPLADATSNKISGALPLTVQFTGSASRDPEGQALTYDWDFGDGTAHSSAPNPSHTYTRAGRFPARLTVTDAGGLTDTVEIEIFPGDTAPNVQIVSPANRSLYRDGVAVNLQGQATDAEDGALTGSALKWTILLHHETHIHPFDEPTGASAQFTPLIDHDSDSYYEVVLTATDSQGLSVSKTIQLDPETINLTLRSEPPGAPITYGGKEFTAPYTARATVGYSATIAAGSPFSSGGSNWFFQSWSDGGTQSHVVNVPATDTTLTARYSTDTDPPETTITAAPTQYSSYPQPKFEFTSDEPGRFECSLDNSPWKPCVSPYRTKELQPGWHGFAVKAFDQAGNVDPTPAVRQFKIINPV